MTVEGLAVVVSWTAGAAVFAAAAAAAVPSRRPVDLIVLGHTSEPRRRGVGSSLERVGAAIARRRPVPPVLVERWRAAGAPLPVGVLVALKHLVPVAFVLLAAASATAAGPAAVAVAVLLALTGYRAPEFVLARLAQRRRARIEPQVSTFAELIAAMVGAGAGLHVALRRAAVTLPSPLADELAVAVAETELGQPLRAVLERLEVRCGAPSLRRLVRSVVRAQRLGTPVAAALGDLGAELKRERRTRAEEAARKAPVKMLFPLVFLILPAFLLLTVGPVVLSTIRSLGTT